MKRIDELALDYPEFGARRLAVVLKREGHEVTRRQASRMMRMMGLEAVYCRPRTSQPAPGHKKYPYLLRNREIKEVDEVWCADITYVVMKEGYGYLTAVMDWKTRAVLGWSLSNTLQVSSCVEAFRKAVAKAGKAPTIFNTDQGCQFTSQEWIGELDSHGIQISMDGRGRWMDNVFIERLWRSVKHEGIYLWAHENLREVERELTRWFERYNFFKPHQSLGYKTPWEMYRPEETQKWEVAA